MTHTIEQPGLHAHSWNPETDLLKQFVVQKSLGENKGWLALSSFHDYEDAIDDMEDREGISAEPRDYRVWDQFENKVAFIDPESIDWDIEFPFIESFID